MTLFEKIQKILYENSLGVNEFLEKTGFSNNFYYNIKGGDKNKLSPKQAKRINEKFSEYSYEWLMSEGETIVNEDVFYKIEKDTGIGLYLRSNHERLMKEDATYEMFIDKISAERALKMVKDLLSSK